MTKIFALTWVFILSFFILFAASAFALEAGLASQHIEVRTDFSGTQLVIFGALARDRRPNDHVAIMVRGPERHGVVWKKQHIAGLWVNAVYKDFDKMSSFYALATSKPQTINGLKFLQKERSLWTEALEDILAKRKLFLIQPKGIEFLGKRLFHAKIDLPPNAPIGDYEVTIALLDKKNIRKQIMLPLDVNKTGWGQTLFWLAREWSFFYGLFAVLLALFIGWAVPAFLRNLF